MIEKVNPSHPDKIADRIAGAIVDLGYKKNENPKIAVELLIGHGRCHIIIETSENFEYQEIERIVNRIAGNLKLDLLVVPQDKYLLENQQGKIKAGDNGIFKGVPLTKNEKELSSIAKRLYKKFSTDGKYILDDNKLIICQSNASKEEIIKEIKVDREIIINPLGNWSGGINVDSGAVNRKLGSDMAQSLTGGGLHGKDLSKADVSINIYAFLKAQKLNKTVELNCAIGDEIIDDKPYEEVVIIAKNYIESIGGFEKFAEWGLY